MSEEEFYETIEKLRRQGKDDSLVEAKESSRSLSKDVWESVSSFANTSGGTIILGLSEKEGFAPVEGFDIERVRDQFLYGMGDGGSKGRLTNTPHYSLERHEIDGAFVLVATIDELDPSFKPCFITDRGVQGGSYKRVDDADIPLSANEIYSLQNANVVSVSDRAPLPGTSAADLDREICAQAFASARQLTPRALKGAETDVARMQRLNFLNTDGGVTKAGLLSAGLYPQQFFPKLHVDVAVHAGRQKSLPGNPRFLDRAICEGTIGEMIDETVSAVARNLRIASFVKEVGRVDELELPIVVLREAVTNALIHREYDPRFDGEAVSVDVYDDRVEIANPGGLWGGKSRDSLTDGRSCCRNATLMKLMSIVPLPAGAGSPAEGNGTGILMMVSECAKKGLKAPVFCPSIDHFKVVLFRPDGSSPLVGRGEAVILGEEVVLEMIRRHGSLSMRELQEKTGLSVNQVRSRLRDLLERGEISATAPATSKNRRYVPNTSDHA